MGNAENVRSGLSDTKTADLAEQYLRRFKKDYEGVKLSRRVPCANALTKNACHKDFHVSCLIPHADHTDVWIKDGKAVLITTQPYNMGIEKLRDIIEFCDKWGLEFSIKGGSWHYPGFTKMLMFYAKGTKPWEISESS